MTFEDSATSILADLGHSFHSEVAEQASYRDYVHRVLELRVVNSHVTHRQPSITVYQRNECGFFVVEGHQTAYSVDSGEIGSVVVELVRESNLVISYYDIDHLNDKSIVELGGPIAEGLDA